MNLYIRDPFQCPRCKEFISADSRVCMYCGRVFKLGEIEKIRNEEILKGFGTISVLTLLTVGIYYFFNKSK